MGRARTLAQVYRHFGEIDVAGTSPLYERVAVALSESDEALHAIGTAPARKRRPTVILAALHDFALAGHAPALAAAYVAASVAWLADRMVLDDVDTRRHRLYPVLVSLQTVLSTVSPRSSWAERLVQLLEQHPRVPLPAMGLFDGWSDDPFWVVHLRR